MSDSANIALARRLYDSGMAPEVTSEIMSPDLVWDVTPGFPNSGIYHGWESVGRDFFGSIAPSYESFYAGAEQFYADEEGHVFVYGHYQAVVSIRRRWTNSRRKPEVSGRRPGCRCRLRVCPRVDTRLR
jgi:hypothetical protein